MITNKTRLKKGLLVFAVFTIVLLILGAGSTQITNDKDKVTNLVNQYEKSYITFLKDQDLNKLKPFATVKQLKKIEIYANYFKEQHQTREINDLISLKIDQLKISKESAVVNTLEVWNVRFEDLTTNKVTEQGEGFYKNTFNLVKINGQWLVDYVNLTEVLKK